MYIADLKQSNMCHQRMNSKKLPDNFGLLNCTLSTHSVLKTVNFWVTILGMVNLNLKISGKMNFCAVRHS